MSKTIRLHGMSTVAVTVLVSVLSGCSLGLDFDRSKIKKADADAGQVGDGGPIADAGPKKDAGKPMKDAAVDAATNDAGHDAAVTHDDAGDDAGADCTVASQCPGADTTCSMRTCLRGVCGVKHVANGTAVASQVAADCKKVVCDGSGHEKTVADTTDVPAQTDHDCQDAQCNGAGAITHVANNSDVPLTDNNQCTNDTCANGVPYPAKGDGMACSQNSGHFCLGTACVACAVASNCGTDTECSMHTCDASGACGLNLPNNVAIASQTPHDCKEVQCNGAGGNKSVNKDTDKPDDGNDCTDEVCTTGTPSHPNSTRGATCATGGNTKCDGNGTCVQCVLDAQCGAGLCVDDGCTAKGTLSAVSATPASLVAGATANLTLLFTTAGSWGKTGVLSVVFPSSYDVSHASLVSENVSGSLALGITGQQVTLTRSGGTTLPASTAVSVVLGGVRIPQVSGTTNAIALATQTSAAVDIDTGSAAGVMLTPSTISNASVVPASTAISATGVVTITGTTTNPWDRAGSIDLQFPSDFNVSGATLTSFMGSSGMFVLSVSGQIVTLTRQGDGTTTDSSTLTIVLDNIVNPNAAITTGSTVLTTRIGNGIAIDRGTAPGVDIM